MVCEVPTRDSCEFLTYALCPEHLHQIYASTSVIDQSDLANMDEY